MSIVSHQQTPEQVELQAEARARILRLVDERTQQAENAYNVALPPLPRTMDAHDIEANAGGQIEWAVTDFWTRASPILLAAEEKSGKTFVVCSLAVSVASGLAVFGKLPVVDPGPVLIVAGEGSKFDVPRRLKRLSEGAGLTLRDLPINFLYGPALKLNRKRDMQYVFNEAERTGAKLVVIDPLARLMEGDENCKETVASVLNPLLMICDKLGASVCLVHHLAKQSTDNPRAINKRSRGSTDIASWYSTGIFVSGNPASGQVCLSVTQRVRGNIPDSLQVELNELGDAPEDRPMRLVAKFPNPNEKRRQGDEEVEKAIDAVLDLLHERGAGGLSTNELLLHTGFPRLVLGVAIKRIILEMKQAFWEKTDETGDTKLLFPARVNCMTTDGVPIF